MSPRVSIILPAFNAERYIAPAIESLLTQSFGDFELLVIDDGSTDKTPEVVAGISDSRLRYYRNQENLRLSATLNRGLDLSVGNYIARMDADDLALPQRIALQVAYLDCHPDVDVVGTGMRKFDDRQNGLLESRPVTDPHLLRWRQHFSNQINHPTVMLRRAALDRLGLRYGVIPNWAEQRHRALETVAHLSEDYLLFGLMAMRGRVHNLPDALLRYRVHAQSVSNSQMSQQLDMACQVSRILFEYVIGAPVDAEAVAACYFTRARSLPENTILAATALIDSAVAAHIRRYDIPAVSQARILRDADLRKRVLQRDKVGVGRTFLEFLKQPFSPCDVEEWRLAARLCLSERAVDRLKVFRTEFLGRISAYAGKN